MKVLLTTQPAYGHLHPLVPIARALEAAGHEVAFACAPAFSPAIEKVGFRSFPGGFDWLESRSLDAFPELQEMTGPEAQSFVVKDIFAGVTAREMALHLLNVAEDWEPQLIVCEMYEFGGYLAAQKLAIPHAIVGLGQFTPREAFADFVGSRLEEQRSFFGLPPDPALRKLREHLYLNFAPRSFVPADETVHALRPLIFDASGDEGVPDGFDSSASVATVYMTMGTVFNKIPGVFEAVLDGLRHEAVQVVMTIGRDRDPADFGSQPPHVHIERYIPQSALLPHCDVVVSHGGYNTVMAALAHGLPQLILPRSADQPHNAQRCAELGAGLVVSREMLSPEAVRNAVRELIGNPSYRDRAREISREMRALPGPERAVELLERLVV